MRKFPRSFEVYGFTIEVHAGGRRVWPPSFKRFIKEKLDNGELALADVMQTCNVSQSLVYKWRADVKTSHIQTATVTEDTFFAEVIVGEERDSGNVSAVHPDHIQINGHAFNVSLPATYPVQDLVKVILAIEGRT